jgi:hypothetical protein
MFMISSPPALDPSDFRNFKLPAPPKGGKEDDDEEDDAIICRG